MFEDYFKFFMFKFEYYTIFCVFWNCGNPAFGMTEKFGWIISTLWYFYFKKSKKTASKFHEMAYRGNRPYCLEIYESLIKNNVSKIDISIEPNQTREPSVPCGYILHVNISKCVYWLDIQSAKVWWIYNTSDMNGYQ